MKREDYIETIIVGNQMVNIGQDDYGQCYYFEYFDEDEQQLLEIGCGAYNFNYKQEIEDYFKYILKK